MPFTPAHIAAVVPLRSRWQFVWSALVVGSIAPDFEYFILGAPATHLLHYFPEFLYLTFPASLLALWVYETFIHVPISEVLPEDIRSRMSDEEFRWAPASRFGWIVVSLLVGIFTHVVWDAFTHEGTKVTTRLHWLQQMVPVPGYGPRALFRVLQYGTGLFGLAVVLVAFVYWWSVTPRRPAVRRRYGAGQKIAISLLIVLAAALGGFAVTMWKFGHTAYSTRYMVSTWIVSGMAVCFWTVLAFGVIVKTRDSMRRASR